MKTMEQTCLCGHRDSQHYDQAGRCGGNGHPCNCCLYIPPGHPWHRETHTSKAS